MKETTGSCRFCGQNKIVFVLENLSDGEELIEASEEATLQCRCAGAKAYQDKKEREARIASAKESARGTTWELFSEEYPEVKEILDGSMDALVRGTIRKVSVAVNGKTSASISFDKETFKVQRVDKSTATRETEI